MLQLKPLSKEGIQNALEKATRYRLLNDPWQAESICRDILEVDPENQEALNMLILSISDQFGSRTAMSLPKALELVTRLKDDYARTYYKGLIYERKANAALKRSTPHSGYIAYDHLHQAMQCYEEAEQLHPEKNEESILRWNACVRMIQQRKLKPAPPDDGIQPFLDV